MRPRDIYKACNYGVIDLNKGEDIITCLLCERSEGGGGQRICSIMSSFRQKIRSIRYNYVEFARMKCELLGI